jgi:hypothetical protein
MAQSLPTLFLCAGLQGSGSTIVSWCFLQRADMDGVLDGEFDLLPQIDFSLGRPFAWYKTTISSFRASELVGHYEDLGWDVRPLLIARDVRSVWASLLTKPYGVNGFSAEDPPLRMRFRRFKDDWQLFRDRGWPILRYESLLENHERTLRDACTQLALSWDEAMQRWPKRADEIADAGRGSDSFRRTQGQCLADTLATYCQQKKADLPIAVGDLAWLEDEFCEFNAHHRYPLHLDLPADEGPDVIEICKFQQMRRYRWELQRKPIRWLLDSLGMPDHSLDERFVKKAG